MNKLVWKSLLEMPQHTAHPTPAQATDLLARTLGRHSTVSIKDESALRKLHPLVRGVSRGSDIVCQGDRPNVAVMVISGMLARYHTTQGGDRQYLSLHIAGDLPDLQSLFLGVMDHSLCALNDAQIAMFRHAEILSLLKRSPSQAIPLWRHTLIDGAIFRQGITRNSSRSAVTRIANLFCEQFTRARIVGLARGWSCPFPLSQTKIGQVVGLSIATVNRASQTLRNENCAQVRAGDWMFLTGGVSKRWVGLSRSTYAKTLRAQGAKLASRAERRKIKFGSILRGQEQRDDALVLSLTTLIKHGGLLCRPTTKHEGNAKIANMNRTCQPNIVKLGSKRSLPQLATVLKGRM